MGDPCDTVNVEIHSVLTAIVTLTGKHDMSTQPDVALALRSASVCPSMLVDLTACTFVDLSVLGSILQARREQQARDGDLGLISPPGAAHMRRTLEVMGIDRLLEVHETRQAGIDSVSL